MPVQSGIIFDRDHASDEPYPQPSPEKDTDAREKRSPPLTGSKGGTQEHHASFLANSQSNTELEMEKQMRESTSPVERLERLATNSGHPLLQIKTVFPFDLFPDEIILDAMKVMIIKRAFFASEQIRVLHIKDITDVSIETSPFFCTLRIIHIKDKFPYVIKPLRHRDAIKAGGILQSLLMAKYEKLDTAKLSINQETAKRTEHFENPKFAI